MEMTVKDYMENELAGLEFEPDECERAVEFAMRNINKRTHSHRIMVTKDGVTIPLNESWNTGAGNYTGELLEFLFKLVRFETLLWCRNELRSRK